MAKTKSEVKAELLLDNHYKVVVNAVRLHQGETLVHALAKFFIVWEAVQNGQRVVTEAIFKDNSGRADVFNLSTKEAIEVLASETLKSGSHKDYSYPVPVVRLKAGDVIKHYCSLCKKPVFEGVLN